MENKTQKIRDIRASDPPLDYSGTSVPEEAGGHSQSSRVRNRTSDRVKVPRPGQERGQAAASGESSHMHSTRGTQHAGLPTPRADPLPPSRMHVSDQVPEGKKEKANGKRPRGEPAKSVPWDTKTRIAPRSHPWIWVGQASHGCPPLRRQAGLRCREPNVPAVSRKVGVGCRESNNSQSHWERECRPGWALGPSPEATPEDQPPDDLPSCQDRDLLAHTPESQGPNWHALSRHSTRPARLPT